LSVADAYEAMTDVRPYRPPMPETAAVAELRRCSGIQFDPEVVQAFLRAKGLELTEAPTATPALEADGAPAHA
ncbi:MAG: HD-GYP domain-containing protein, partial [Rudaea sp.]